MWWLVVLLAGGALATKDAGPLYCSVNTFKTNTSWMHFTKEPVPFEFGFQDKFKSIHCCAKGHRSIEWFKDGVAYPWSAGVSNLILYPEAANQTLYVRRAARSDSGNYTCRLRNDTHSETHTVKLDILEKPTDAPKIMFISKDQWVEEGGELRLYCEALIGRSYLADARSDLRWSRVWPNGTEGTLLPSQSEVTTTRDDVADIIGSYLTVAQTAAPDYGVYVCVVHSNDVVSRNYVTVHYKQAQEAWSGGRTLPWRSLALGLAGVAALAACALGLRGAAPALRLAARTARERARPQAHRARVLEKECDVVVCWTAVDEELVRGALLPTLHHKYHYRVRGQLVSTKPDSWYNELAGAVSRSRSVVAVVSPAQYSAPQLLLALRQLRALPVPPVVVLLQDLPKLKREAKESGESLVSVLRRTRLVAWRRVHDRAFWTALRLALPVPPPRTLQDKPKPECSSSRSGSLTALV